jgi:TetR/AcrR family transcriptional regulator, regulator of cefoperazone and chloramphenicol sensitivity
MLIMSSATMPSATEPDRTGRARIRDAAIEQFGARGVDGTSLKVIAEAAGVSQPLIVHHFGSKAGLRAACDAHVTATIRAAKFDAMSRGPQFDPVAALRDAEDSRAVLRYLARTIGDGSPQVAGLIDEMAADAVEYMAEGERTGVVRPSEHPRERAIVLTLWSLGLLALHDHAERLLGIDLMGEPDQLGAYLLPAMELLSRGVLAEGIYEQARDAFAGKQENRS